MPNGPTLGSITRRASVEVRHRPRGKRGEKPSVRESRTSRCARFSATEVGFAAYISEKRSVLEYRPEAAATHIVIRVRCSKFSLAWTLGVWGLSVGVGHLLLGAYDTRPGEEGSPRTQWPVESYLQPDSERSNVVLFLHPSCPCSEASVQELAELLEPFRSQLVLHVVRMKYDRTTASRTIDLSALTRAGIKVAVWPDLDGEEVQRFGVSTSGHLLVYGARGELIFSGGVTPSRGHRGPNDGRTAIEQWFRFGVASRSSHSVFGCSFALPKQGTNREALP